MPRTAATTDGSSWYTVWRAETASSTLILKTGCAAARAVASVGSTAWSLSAAADRVDAASESPVVSFSAKPGPPSKVGGSVAASRVDVAEKAWLKVRSAVSLLCHRVAASWPEGSSPMFCTAVIGAISLHSASNQATDCASSNATVPALEVDGEVATAVSGASPTPLPEMSDDAVTPDVAAAVGDSAVEPPGCEPQAFSSSAPAASSAAGVRRFMHSSCPSGVRRGAARRHPEAAGRSPRTHGNHANRNEYPDVRPLTTCPYPQTVPPATPRHRSFGAATRAVCRPDVGTRQACSGSSACSACARRLDTSTAPTMTRTAMAAIP